MKLLDLLEIAAGYFAVEAAALDARGKLGGESLHKMAQHLREARQCLFDEMQRVENFTDVFDGHVRHVLHKVNGGAP